jgi:chorismate mutase
MIQMSIEDWRAEIDMIDQEIIRLLNMRAKLAVKIGAAKMTSGLPIGDPGREQDVINRALNGNSGPLDEQAVDKIFRQIISESRRVEEHAVDGKGASS